MDESYVNQLTDIFENFAIDFPSSEEVASYIEEARREIYKAEVTEKFSEEITTMVTSSEDMIRKVSATYNEVVEKQAKPLETKINDLMVVAKGVAEDANATMAKYTAARDEAMSKGDMADVKKDVEDLRGKIVKISAYVNLMYSTIMNGPQ